MQISQTNRFILILAIASVCCFFPFLGAAHLFDWDELNFAESAREMLITRDYFRVYIDFIPFTEKPPLFFWMQALSMKVFGINEFAARFPNALLGVVVIITLFNVGKKLVNSQFGFIWALAFIGSLLPHLYFRSGIIDPAFNFFMFSAIVFLSRSVYLGPDVESKALYAWAGVFTGLSILTKGPVGFLIVVLSFLVFWANSRFKRLTTFRQILIFILFTFLVSFAWYGVETYRNGTGFLKAFIIRQIEIFTTNDAGHGQPFYYHFIVLLIGCFPVSALALKSFFVRANQSGTETEQFRTWMISVFCVVLTIFSISTTKIVHYSSMAYYPLTFLAAYHICQFSGDHKIWQKITIISGVTITSLLGIAFGLIGLFPYIKETIIPYIKDDFAVANLSANVYWSGFEWIIGVFFMTGCTIGWIKFYHSKIKTGAIWMFTTTALTVLLFTSILVPKIEQYTQGANIRFFKSLSGTNVYAGTAGYKSYAPYFYSDKQPEHMKSGTLEYLAENSFEIPVYLSVKNTYKDKMNQYPVFKLIREENGFLFYLKMPEKE